jgi:uncharacterized protein with HEPN domain
MENKDDHYFLSKIVSDIDKILKYAKRIDFSDSEKNEEAVDAMNFRLLQIRESIKQLSPTFINSHPELHFNVIVSFRNQVTHDYVNVDFSSYKDFIYQDLPKIKERLLKFI